MRKKNINIELQNKIIEAIKERSRSYIEFTEEEFYANREEIKEDLIENLASYSDKEWIENLSTNDDDDNVFTYDDYLQTTVIGKFHRKYDHCEIDEILHDFISYEDWELYQNYELDYLSNDALNDAAQSI